MNKNRQNKNDRKRQRRKDFSHGRDWSATPQDQRSSYPKSYLAIRADAARRAKLAGVDPIDISPGAITFAKGPSIDAVDMMQIYKLMKDQLIQPTMFVVPRYMVDLDLAEPTRPDLHREMKIGEILAYRCWRLVGNQLRSVYMHDDWNPNEIMQGRDIDDWSERGVHAWKDLNSKKFNDYVRGYLSNERDPWRMLRREHEPPTVIVTGTVLLWGDVVEHEHGYRAEFAKINSIDWLYPDASLMGRERETLSNLRQLYGVS